MTKVVSMMTMKEHPKTYQGTQYKGDSSYVGRQRQPQLACGANGMLDPTSPVIIAMTQVTLRTTVSD